MAAMGTDFRNRLNDSMRNLEEALGAECADCGEVFDLSDLFDEFCEHCSLEQRAASDPRFEWDFVQDFQS